jgi:hypothetical protein
MSPWYLLPHQYRPMTHLQQFRIEAFVTPGEGEWTIRVKSDEREDVFAQLTFVLGSEGNLSGGDIHSAGEDKFFLKSGAAEYGVGEDRVEVSSGAFEHRYPILREDHHPSGCKYVHVNLLTPFDRTFTVRLL